MRARLVPIVVTAVFLAACGEAIAPGDAGVLPETDAGASAPSPPVLTPCAEGWREVVDEDGQVVCDPFPESGRRTDCAYDEAHFTGTPGCTRIGPECPADGWPAGLPTDRPIVYVDDDAAAGGDGSTREAAVRTIGDALARSPTRAIIAVASGRYDEEVYVRGQRTLWGACVSGTRLVASTPSPTTAVLSLGGPAEARSFSIDAPERVAMLLDGPDVVLEDFAISSARSFAMYVRSGAVTARRFVVRDTRGDVADASFGRGIDIEPGASVVLEQGVLERNRDVAIAIVGEGSQLDARDVAIVDTMPMEADASFGYGLFVGLAAHASVERAFVELSHETGILTADPDTVLELRDVVVRETQPQEADGNSGDGVVVQNHAALVLERVLLERNRYHGLIAGDGSTVRASDLVIRDTLSEQSTMTSGRGIAIQTGAQLTLDRALLARNRNAGITAHFEGTTIDARDVVIRDTLPQESDGATGVGAWAERGAELSLTRARIERTRQTGIASVLGARA